MIPFPEPFVFKNSLNILIVRIWFKFIGSETSPF